MTPTNEETADLLERAADLYESEIIDWCNGAWAREHGERHPTGGGQYHCAEGALLRAAGYTWEQVLGATRATENTEEDRVFSLMTQPQIQAAIRAVKGRQAGDDGFLWLWQLNDQLLPGPTAKQELIQRFKDAAKELRNGS
jgi:hypothetical protein